MEVNTTIDGNKGNKKMVKSPPHIFDDQLFEQWPSVDEADKLDLGDDISKTEEKSVSFDFEVH